MRRSLIISVAVLVAGAVTATAVLAETGRFGGRLDRQVAKWRDTPVSTSSTAWRTIPGLGFRSTLDGNDTICAFRQLSATVSLTLKGAPVEVRVWVNRADLPMRPGPARFVTGAVPESVSYTFVGNVGTFEADDRHAVEVQWRSPSGRQVTLTRGAVNVLYQQGTHCG